MQEKLISENANVIVHGKVWSDSNDMAIKLSKEDSNSILIHPFDDPLIWEGHSTIITEVAQQMKHKPSVVICTVGGGGLLCGIIKGLKKVGWDSVPVLAVETKGADKLYQSFQKGEIVTLSSITSIAKTLGASKICDEAWNLRNKHKIISCLVTDNDAVNSIINFANDHRVLVEPSCSAGLSILYDSDKKYLKDLDLKDGILVIVCGGNIITLPLLQQWEKEMKI